MTKTSTTIPRTIVLIGMMGCGKTSVGRKLAEKLGLAFVDSDAEIERASGMSIADYFARHGEPAFRDTERNTIAQILKGDPCVLSTGGGAFMDPTTRTVITERAVSVWLKADLDILIQRVAAATDRPLLQGGDLRAKLTNLLALREPVYAEANITVISDNRMTEDTAERVWAAVQKCL